MGRKQAARAALAAICSGMLLSGCGGGGGQDAETTREQTIALGNMVTRVVGTAEPPVSVSGIGSVVTGIAGANFTSLTLRTGPGNIGDTRIAYYSTDSVLPGLNVISPFGGEPVQVLPFVEGNSEPSWSRDGTKLIADGSVRGPVTSSTITDGTSNTVMFSESSAKSNPSTVQVVMGDGSVRAITTTQKDTNPAWWPASRIVFESFRDLNSEIYVMSTDGTLQTRLTNNLSADTNPAWFPDGSKIVFVSDRNGKQQIFQMAADGSSQTVLIAESGFNCWDPQVSPDGNRIAYVTDKDGNSEIYVADITGLNRVRVTTNALSDFDPSWSPDSDQLAYTHLSASGTSEIWMTNLVSSKQGVLVSRGARPYWSPFVTSRPLLGGPNASVGQNASGFIFGQKGDTTTSLVVFTMTTPSGARVKALTPTGLNAPNYVFDVTSADAITLMSYVNDFYARPIVAVSNDGGGLLQERLSRSIPPPERSRPCSPTRPTARPARGRKGTASTAGIS